jgi:hypothetical protein
MANAATKIRNVFTSAEAPLTLTDIRHALPELKMNNHVVARQFGFIHII